MKTVWWFGDSLLNEQLQLLDSVQQGSSVLRSHWRKNSHPWHYFSKQSLFLSLDVDSEGLTSVFIKFTCMTYDVYAFGIYYKKHI